jgi:hypothetical protein
LKIVLLDEASPGDLGVRSSELGVALLAWDESCVFGDSIGLERHGFLQNVEYQ